MKHTRSIAAKKVEVATITPKSHLPTDEMHERLLHHLVHGFIRDPFIVTILRTAKLEQSLQYTYNVVQTVQSIMTSETM